MKKHLAEFSLKEGEIIFDFVGYNDCDDFTKIIHIIEEFINPGEIDYSGITDMSGYFIKDHIRVELEYDGMLGNSCIYKDTGNSEDLEKVRGWAKTIWDELQKRENEPVY